MEKGEEGWEIPQLVSICLFFDDLHLCELDL